MNGSRSIFGSRLTVQGDEWFRVQGSGFRVNGSSTSEAASRAKGSQDSPARAQPEGMLDLSRMSDQRSSAGLREFGLFERYEGFERQ